MDEREQFTPRLFQWKPDSKGRHKGPRKARAFALQSSLVRRLMLLLHITYTCARAFSSLIRVERSKSAPTLLYSMFLIDELKRDLLWSKCETA
ncbi:hypothetical protein XH99_12865 [Bradyrhizobium nanningense]|uniref:Uncharacterized protein n=1 Tax=Bradyrhizobium nanningense TaxID=1325118 RepID=A0A4Q0S5G8_9BRAD|nr:hypothetical protein XH99_12865 [Bradyrhizobium nanningense]